MSVPNAVRRAPRRQGLSDAASAFTHCITKGEKVMPDGSMNMPNSAAAAHARHSSQPCACHLNGKPDGARAEVLAHHLSIVMAHLQKLDAHCQAILATRDFVEARCKQVGEDDQAYEKWNGYTVMLSVTEGVTQAESDLYEAFNRLLEQMPEAAAALRRVEAEEAN